MSIERVTLLASAARTANGTGGVIDVAAFDDGSSKFGSGTFLLVISAVSGVVPTLDCFIQKEMPDGSFGDVVAFGQVISVTKRLAVVAPQNVLVESNVPDTSLTVGSVKGVPLAGKWRIKWVIGGTTPSFTFSVLADFFD